MTRAVTVGATRLVMTRCAITYKKKYSLRGRKGKGIMNNFKVINNFKFIKRGVTYIPIQVTSFTGAVIELFVDEVSFNSGAPADVFTFEELRDSDGGLRVIFTREDR